MVGPEGLWATDGLYLDHVGREIFYGWLASLQARLFWDTDFAEFYCADNGRDSVPPSLLATTLLLPVPRQCERGDGSDG